MEDCSCYGAANCFESGDVTVVHVGDPGETVHVGGTEFLGSPAIKEDHITNSNTRSSSDPIEADLGTSVEQTNEDDRDPPPANEGASSSSTPRLFFGAMAATTVGMTMAVFTSLAGGKIGIFLPYSVFIYISAGMLDLSVMIDDHLNYDAAREPTSTSTLYERVVKRGICWISVGIAVGTNRSAWHITVEPERFGEAWQFTAIMSDIIGWCIQTWVIGRMLMQAHRDRVPNVWRWYVCNKTLFLIAYIGQESPYPLIGAVAAWLFIVAMSVGMYFVVNHIDLKVEREHVKMGYRLMTAGAVAAIQILSLGLSALADSPLINSAFVMLYQMAALSVLIPLSKKCFVDDERKLWSYAIPAYILPIELTQCILFLGSDWDNEFWALLIFQELNSVARNTGMYGALYCFLRSRIGRAVDESGRKKMEEKRAILAPSENVGEIVAPVVLVIVLRLEALFDAMPGMERAPYLADTGILGGWYRMEGRQNQSRRGQTSMMLAVVLVVRLVICWFELQIRNHQRHNRTALAEGVRERDGGEWEGDMNAGTDSHLRRANSRARSRRTSMTVLYNRIVHSRDAPVHMKYLAFGLFCSGPILLVFAAANTGKTRNRGEA